MIVDLEASVRQGSDIQQWTVKELRAELAALRRDEKRGFIDNAAKGAILRELESRGE